MDRRSFLRSIVGAAAVVSIAPSVLLEAAPKPSIVLDINSISLKYLRPAIADAFFTPSPWYERMKRGS